MALVLNLLSIGALCYLMSVSCVPLKSAARSDNNFSSNAAQDVFSANYIIRSLDYLIQDCLAFQNELVSNSFDQATKDSAVTLRFPFLAAQNCGPSQMIERMQAYTEALSRVSLPLRLILNQLLLDNQQRNLANSLVKVQSSYQAVSTRLQQMIEKLLATDVKADGPTLSELERRTIQYIRLNHPAIQLISQNINAFRDYAFIQSLQEAAKIMRSEIQQIYFT